MNSKKNSLNFIIFTTIIKQGRTLYTYTSISCVCVRVRRSRNARRKPPRLKKHADAIYTGEHLTTTHKLHSWGFGVVQNMLRPLNCFEITILKLWDQWNDHIKDKRLHSTYLQHVYNSSLRTNHIFTSVTLSILRVYLRQVKFSKNDIVRSVVFILKIRTKSARAICETILCFRFT